MTKPVDRGPRRRGRLRDRRDERGIVLVYFTICLTVLMVASAFSVDVGAWYTRGGQLQRGADAAAMAGVVWMPGDLARAQATALDTLKANGLDPAANPNLTVTVSQGSSDRRLTVTVTDTKVAQYFSQTFMDSVTMTRTATAEYLAPIPLGSPENNLGNHNPNCTGAPASCKTVPNFVLAINGYCAAAENGDPVASRFDGTKGPNNRTFVGDPLTYAFGQVHCPTGAPTPPEFYNPSYNANGYYYDIEVPGTGGVLTSAYNVDVYDGAYKEGNNDGFGDIDRSLSVDGTNTPIPAHITTNWKLLAPDNTPFDNTDNPIAGNGLAFGTFPDGDPGNVYTAKWKTIATLPIGAKAGTYKLQISTQANEPGSWGQNGFAIRADYNVPFKPCDSTTACVSAKVHAEGQMSLYIDSKDAAKTALIYLAQPDKTLSNGYAGHTMQVKLFDVGDVANNDGSKLEVDKPGGAKMNSWDWSVTDLYSPAITGMTGQNLLDISLLGPILPGRSSNAKYNDRTVMLSVPLLAGDLKNNDGWYLLKYTSGTTNVTDRVTISVTVLASPVHLVAGS